MEWTRYKPLSGDVVATNGELTLISRESGAFTGNHGLWLNSTKILDGMAVMVKIGSDTIPLSRKCTMMTVNPAWINRVYDVEGLSLEDRVFIPQSVNSLRLSYQYRALRPSGVKFDLVLEITPPKGRDMIVTSSRNGTIFFRLQGDSELGCIGYSESPSSIERCDGVNIQDVRAQVSHDNRLRIIFSLEAVLQKTSRLDIALICGQKSIDDCLKALRRALSIQYYDNEREFNEVLESTMQFKSFRRELDQAHLWSRIFMLMLKSREMGLKHTLISELHDLKLGLLSVDGLCCMGYFDEVERLLMAFSRKEHRGLLSSDALTSSLFLAALSAYYQWRGEGVLPLILQEEVNDAIEVCTKALHEGASVDGSIASNALAQVKYLPPRMSSMEWKADAPSGALGLMINLSDIDVKELSLKIGYPLLPMCLTALKLFKNNEYSEGLAVLETIASEIIGKCPHYPLSPHADGVTSSLYTSILARGLLGLRVNAKEMSLTLTPYIPAGVNELEVEGIPIGENRISMRLDVRGEEVNLRISNHGAKRVHGELGFIVKRQMGGVKALTDYGEVKAKVEKLGGYVKITLKDSLDGDSTRTYTFSLG